MTDTAVMYDDRVWELIEEIEGEIAAARGDRGLEREHRLKVALDNLREAKKTLHSLKVEISVLPSGDRPNFEKKAKAHSAKLTELTNVVKQMKEADMSAAPTASDMDYVDDGRDEVRAAHTRIAGHQDKSLAILNNCVKTVTETEKVANETNQELLRQRAQIEEIDRKMDELGDDLTRAKRELNAFVRRMASDKLILCFLFLLVVGIVVAIILHFVVGGDDDSTPAPPKS
eukprot:TRINITY_DN800_c0_g1_i4.p1 TRINITY_DN800_c0_g1~~TRINITY_DN800_c0_g1_i4.p1  ORF type:complete len:266 (+),score=63.82 TRINITY_DN800_c0_g1_i4:111-800(+)